VVLFEAKEGIDMASLIRRENRDFSRRQGSEALDPFRIMDALLGGDAFQAFDAWNGPRGFAPSFEVRETKEAYVFKADLPGVAEKELEIHMTGNVLTVSGERKQENVQEGERYFAIERGYGQFSRSFSLPDGSDGEHIAADLKDGVLTLRVPKKPEVQAKRITIGTSSGGASTGGAKA
jgi:HSP20 family protein